MNDIQRLQGIYGAAGRELKALCLGVDVSNFKIFHQNEIMARTKDLVRAMNIATERWAAGAIPKAYDKSSRVAKTALQILGKKPVRKPFEDRKRRLQDDLMVLLIRANNSIPRTMERYLSVAGEAAQKIATAQVKEFNFQDSSEDVARMAQDALRKELSRGELSEKIRDYLYDLVENDEFIEIGGRMYQMKKYAELVGRTTLREAQTSATLDLCRQYENDLVEVSSHGTICEECKPYEGNIYSISGMSSNYPKLDAEPPFHPNCLLPGTRCISPGGIVAGSQAWYRGQAIELSFSNGIKLSVTANHLLLTPQGFASANLLRDGDNIFYCPDFERIIATNPNNDRKPTLIEEIIGSLTKTRGMTTRSMPTSPEYLHGDGRFFYGDIDIVGSNSLLRNAGKSDPAKKVHKHDFGPTDIGLFDFIGPGDLRSMLERLALAADGIMGGLRTPSPFFLSRAGGGDPMTFTHGSKGNSANDKPSMDILISDFEKLRQITLKIPGLIQTTKLINIRRFEFSGHVYDLQSLTSLYIANGIISSNCEHSLLPTSEEAISARGEA